MTNPTTPETHTITIEHFPYFSSGVVYRAVCSCGRYRSGKQGSRRYAEKCGQDHVDSKSATSLDT